MNGQVMQLRERVKNPASKRNAKYDWRELSHFAPGLYVVDRCPMDLPTGITEKLKEAGKEIPEEVYIYKVGGGGQHELQTHVPLDSKHKGHEVLLGALDEVISNRLATYWFEMRQRQAWAVLSAS